MSDVAAIDLVDVARRYRLTDGREFAAVDGVSLSIAAGETVALEGPSGSGKSTLLHLIGALDRADEGRVIVEGRELSALSRRELAEFRRGIGFVFQRFNLLPALSVLDNVVAPVLPYRVGFDKRARAGELLEAVGLGGRERSSPTRLSGGQQQRVAIARALINAPSLLLADEPTGNLDSRTGDEIVDLLLRLRAERGMTILVATHDPRLSERCDRAIRLLDGKLVDVDEASVGLGRP